MWAGSAGSVRVCSVNNGWKNFWRDVSFPLPWALQCGGEEDRPAVVLLGAVGLLQNHLIT